MTYLREHHSRNVGILKFRVKKGNQPVNFNVGPLNDNIVGRLEYALIHANSTQRPIGIIQDANQIATAKKLPRYDKPAGQRALFAQKYPLAWGDAQVNPDLFLTGIVTVRPDLKSVTVVLEAFGPNSAKQDKVLTFQVDTDRSLLTDLNESFQVKSRSLKRRTRNIDLDEEAVADAARRTIHKRRARRLAPERFPRHQHFQKQRREASRLPDPLRRRSPAGHRRSRQSGRIPRRRAERETGGFVRRPLARSGSHRPCAHGQRREHVV